MLDEQSLAVEVELRWLELARIISPAGGNASEHRGLGALTRLDRQRCRCGVQANGRRVSERSREFCRRVALEKMGVGPPSQKLRVLEQSHQQFPVRTRAM